MASLKIMQTLTLYPFEFIREEFNKASSVSNMSQTGPDTFVVAPSKGNNPIITTARRLALVPSQNEWVSHANTSLGKEQYFSCHYLKAA